MTNINRSSLGSLKGAIPLTGDLAVDVPVLLVKHGLQTTADHSRRVADEARRIAGLFRDDCDMAVTAAWLHDISAILPPSEQVARALTYGLDVLPEEREHPVILHQKLSAVLAGELFGVTDQAVLTAIGCHTTLRANAARLDMILYVADKLAWDQSDAAPYEASMRAGLAESLEAAALAHLNWMHAQRETLRVVHPWLREAYEWLSGKPW